MVLNDVVASAKKIFWELPEVLTPVGDEGWSYRGMPEACRQGVSALSLGEVFEVLRDLADSNPRVDNDGLEPADGLVETLQQVLYWLVWQELRLDPALVLEDERCDNLMEDARFKAGVRYSTA